MDNTPETSVPNLDEIDDLYILRAIRDQSSAAGLRSVIKLHLSLEVPTTNGPARVSRDVDLTPDEVIGVLERRNYEP